MPAAIGRNWPLGSCYCSAATIGCRFASSVNLDSRGLQGGEMLTQVKNAQDVFYLPQRLLVPLFQRPYVWSQEAQWEPLWSDVVRVAERQAVGDSRAEHFLGAVVLQQQPSEIGTLTTRIIIDGQQRLTTLQLMMDAIHDRLIELGFSEFAHQLLDLTRNQAHQFSEGEDQFKVWPTNRDRPAYVEVMSQVVTDSSELLHGKSRMIEAHRFFLDQAQEWLTEEPGQERQRVQALVRAVVTQLQLVVIDLNADEDAQEIFETLNARGTPLSAADLIKNFIFQRLNVPAEEQEKIYHDIWEHFETPFWETVVSSGRVNYSRTSLFLSQWLVSQARREITGREVFTAFKRHVIDADVDMLTSLKEIRALADKYESITRNSMNKHQPLNRVELFTYRVNTLQSEVVKPVLLWLIDPTLQEIPQEQLDRALSAIESWLIRRTLVRATTKGYNKLVIELLQTVARRDRLEAGTNIERFLAAQTSPTTYWPGDDEVRRELEDCPIYLRLSRARLRMILEAIEDQRRGFGTPKPKHEQRIVRDKCTVEHVLPQQWQTNWGVESLEEQINREKYVHRLGNLTLATQALNSGASNLAWLGEDGKKELFKLHTSLLITKEVVDKGTETWSEELIDERTNRMIQEIMEIWPVPEGHTGVVSGARSRLKSRVTIVDLVNTELLSPGQFLYARIKGHRGEVCEIAHDGRLLVNGEFYASPSAAAKAVTKSQSEAGWWFWVLSLDDDVCLSDVRRDYLDLQGLAETFNEDSDEIEIEN